MNKEHIWTFVIVVLGVIVGMIAINKLKLNSFEEFERVA